jgi:hypothetical protein
MLNEYREVLQEYGIVEPSNEDNLLGGNGFIYYGDFEKNHLS